MKKSIVSAIIIGTLGLTAFPLHSCRTDYAETTNPSNAGIDANNFKAVLKSGDHLILNASTTYHLKGALLVNNGATLTIPAGTKIIASGGTETYIAIAQGGKIFSNGTAENPVVITGASGQKAAWGGVVICGKAPINTGPVGSSEVARLPYGGIVSDDNSGVITYTVLKHTGARFDGQREYNGLSLFGVGNGTKIEGVSIMDGADDGIELFGGTVNISKIISINNDDDAFDWTDGWAGTATAIYGKRLSATVGNRGIEADNNKGSLEANPRSNPSIKNATFIGFTTTDNEGGGSNLFRVGTWATIDNLVVSGWETGLEFKDASTIDYFNQGGKIKNVKFENVKTKVKGLNADVITAMENAEATGAGNGSSTPDWAKGWAGIH